MTDKELLHYGILGMKWGKRKKRYDEPSGRKRSANSNEYEGRRPVVSPDNIVKSKKKEIDRFEKQKAKQEKREAAAKKYEDKNSELTRINNDLKANGVKSESFRKMYGDRAAGLNDATFEMIYGISKQKAVQKAIDTNKGNIAHNKRAAKAKREGKLTDTQKIAIGAAVVVGAIVAGKALSDYKIKKTAGANLSGTEFMSRFRKSHMVSGSKAYKGLLDDNDIVVPSGTTFKRMSADPEYNVRKNVYAAFTEDDVKRYKGILPTYFNWIPKDSAYQISLEAKTDIIAPSLRKRVDTFTNMLSESPEYRQKYNIPEFSTPKMIKEYGKKYYSEFALHDAGKTKMGNAYFDKLSEMGYNAWVDDNDRGRLSDIPMVIFNRSGELERTGAVKISQGEIKEAAEIIKELSNRII